MHWILLVQGVTDSMCAFFIQQFLIANEIDYQINCFIKLQSD